MFSINVNGKDYQVEKDMAIIDFLRNELRLTSVKNGCEQGACGTCSVIADGRVIRACIMKVSRFQGKKILTVEGLSQREKDVFVYSFGSSGAVQCGFCIPGMVIAAKALLDNNPNPTRTEVKKALRGNICRCTGYIKIEDAVLKAAAIFRGEEEYRPEDTGKVGESTFRLDVERKVLGQTKYVDDMVLEDMVYAKAIRPPYARCKVLSIDYSQALKLDGIIRVITADDIPGSKKIGHLMKDQDVLVSVGEETKYIGDAVAIVVAENKEILEEAIDLINVEYKELKPITNPFEAMEEDAPQIHGGGFKKFGKDFVPKNNVLSHEVLKRGDVDKAFKEAKYIVEDEFYTPPTDHLCMEPECAIAIPTKDGGISVITSSQGVYDEQEEISEMLGIEPSKIRAQAAEAVGGGFGGKEDLTVQHHSSLAAYLCKRPVKIIFSREESLNISVKRHPMWMKFKLACDEEGYLLAMQAKLISDTGAFASLGGPVLQRACTHAAGPYNYQNIDIDGKAVYTNNPPNGAFRGFGVPQSNFAMEALVDRLAEKVGISPWEIRYKNAIRPGQVLPNGQIADEGTAFAETLELCRDFYNEYSSKEGYYVGMASAMKNAGLGVGVHDVGRCNLKIENKKIHAYSSAADMGQGIQTIIAQIICETVGCKPSDININQPDTLLTPNAGTTTASRQTVFTGEATRKAATKLKWDLDSGLGLDDLEGRLYEGEYFFETDPIGSDKDNPVSHVAYGYCTHVVVLNEDGKIEKVFASHDSGRIINPLSAQGQIDGGVVMSMGYALTENFPLEEGIPQAGYGKLGLLRADEVPKIYYAFAEKNDPQGIAYGAKGIGEITTIPTAPAILNAYYKKDGKIRKSLPLENTAYSK